MFVNTIEPPFYISIFDLLWFSDDASREERGELMAAQVDIPSEDDTPREEKDALESTTNHHKGNSEYGKDL